MIAKTYNDMTEAELLEVKSNFEANKLITENNIKMYQNQVDVINKQLELIDNALQKLKA